MIKLKRGMGGKAVHKIIVRAIEKRKENDMMADKSRFCRNAGISRSQLHRYKHGDEPSLDALAKIAVGLREWGYKVEVVI